MFLKKSVVGYILLIAAATAAAQVSGPRRSNQGPNQQPARPELETIVERMEQAARENRESYRAYVITRDYRLYGSGDKQPQSEVIAEISFVPPTSTEYRIERRTGSSRGESVVRRILDSQRKDATSGGSPAAVTRENYEFTLLGEQKLQGGDCYVLGLQPKRKEKSLLIGRAWVDRNTYLVRRVQGQMSKTPSWWVKSAEVMLDFGNVEGMWLHTRTRATADVRLFGRHTLTENAVKIRTGTTAAALIRQRPSEVRRRFRRPEAVLGTMEH